MPCRTPGADQVNWRICVSQHLAVGRPRACKNRVFARYQLLFFPAAGFQQRFDLAAQFFVACASLIQKRSPGICIALLRAVINLFDLSPPLRLYWFFPDSALDTARPVPGSIHA